MTKELAEPIHTNHQRIYEAARGLSLELQNVANRLPVSHVEELHELVEWLDESVKDVLHVADHMHRMLPGTSWWISSIMVTQLDDSGVPEDAYSLGVQP